MLYYSIHLFLLLCLPQFTTAEPPLVCPEHAYDIQLFSTSPLFLYISNFLSKDELKHLQNIDSAEFKASKVNFHKNSVEDTGAIEDTTRRSSSYVPPRDTTIQCIEQRAHSIQGYGQTAGRLERIQLVKYGTSDEYKHHFDWSDTPTSSSHDQNQNPLSKAVPSQDAASAFDNRQSTIFAYVETNCTGGGTNFPRLNAPEDERWCEVVDCDEEWAAGVTFKPIQGNAVFWQNLVGGKGIMDTYHAGLPVTSGLKIGMNIFTKEKPT